MVIKILLFALILYLLIRFIFKYILPIVGVVRVTQRNMHDMQMKVREMERKQKADQNRKSEKIEGEYIEYEEIKKSSS